MQYKWNREVVVYSMNTRSICTSHSHLAQPNNTISLGLSSWNRVKGVVCMGGHTHLFYLWNMMTHTCRMGCSWLSIFKRAKYTYIAKKTKQHKVYMFSPKSETTRLKISWTGFLCSPNKGKTSVSIRLYKSGSEVWISEGIRWVLCQLERRAGICGKGRVIRYWDEETRQGLQIFFKFLQIFF